MVTNIAAPFISLPTRNIPPLRIPQDSVSKGPGRRQVAPGCAGRAGGGHAPAVRQVEAARPPKGALPFVTLEGSESPEVEDVLQGENVASVDFLFHTGCVRLLGPPPPPPIFRNESSSAPLPFSRKRPSYAHAEYRSGDKRLNRKRRRCRRSWKHRGRVLRRGVRPGPLVQRAGLLSFPPGGWPGLAPVRRASPAPR